MLGSKLHNTYNLKVGHPLLIKLGSQTTDFYFSYKSDKYYISEIIDSKTVKIENSVFLYLITNFVDGEENDINSHLEYARIKKNVGHPLTTMFRN